LGIVAVKMTSRRDQPPPPHARRPAPPPLPERPEPREPVEWPPSPDEPTDPFANKPPSPPERWQRQSEEPDPTAAETPVAPEIVPQPVEPPREPRETEPSPETPEPPAEQTRPTRETTKPSHPDKAAREEARKAIRRRFHDRYQGAKNPHQLRGLAFLLFQQAANSGEEDATRYVLLEEATAIAIVSGGGHPFLQRAASTISDQFDVSREEAMVELIRHMADQPMTPAVCAMIVTNTVTLAAEDVRDERFESARALLDVVH